MIKLINLISFKCEIIELENFKHKKIIEILLKIITGLCNTANGHRTC